MDGGRTAFHSRSVGRARGQNRLARTTLDVNVAVLHPNAKRLERRTLAGPIDAHTIAEAIRGAVRPAHEIGAVVGEKLARAAIERNRQMSTEVAVGHDSPVTVPKHQGLYWPALVVHTEAHLTDVARTKLTLATDTRHDDAHDFPGVA